MVNPSQFLDPDVFFVVHTEHLLTSYLLLLLHRDGFLVCVNKRF